MISITGCGWGKFTTDSFVGDISYNTEVPLDLLNASLEYLRTQQPQAVYCDEECSCFTFVLQDYPSFIISERDKPVLYSIEKSAIDIIRELLKDIERETPEKWAMEFSLTDADFARLKSTIKKRVKQIKEELKQR